MKQLTEEERLIKRNRSLVVANSKLMDEVRRYKEVAQMLANENKRLKESELYGDSDV